MYSPKFNKPRPQARIVHRAQRPSTPIPEIESEDTFILQEKQLMNQISTLLEQVLKEALLTADKTRSPEQCALFATQLIEHNASLASFIQKLYSKLTEFEGNSDEKDATLDSLHRTLLTKLKTKARETVQSTHSESQFTSKLMTFDFGYMLHAQLKYFSVKKPLGSSDIRVYYEENRLQRRYDSLSRLFNMSQELSPCFAVTMHEGELIISSNVAEEDMSHQIAQHIRQKLIIIRRALSNVLETPAFINDYPFYVSVVNELKAHGGTSLPDFILIQALYKLIQATICTIPDEEVNNNDYFTTNEQALLLHSPQFVILVPERNDIRKDKKRYVMTIYQGNTNRNGRMYATFPIFEKDHAIHHFHAEQMIAYYLNKSKGINLNNKTISPIRIGISKLCCATCALLNQFEAIRMRGTSQVAFPNTANLFEKDLLPVIADHVASPCATRVTYAPSSPWTPDVTVSVTGKQKVRRLIQNSSVIDFPELFGTAAEDESPEEEARDTLLTRQSIFKDRQQIAHKRPFSDLTNTYSGNTSSSIV